MMRYRNDAHKRMKSLGVTQLTAEQELELVHRAREGDMDARRRVIEGALPYALKIVSSYTRWKRIDLEDLRQQAFIGVVRSFEHFDPSYGLRFARYAGRYVDILLKRMVLGEANAVTMRHSAAGLRALKAIRQGAQDVDTLVKEHDVGAEMAYSILYWLCSEEVPLGTGLASDEPPAHLLSAEQAVEIKEVHEKLERWLQKLEPKLRHILEERFGLCGEPRTLESIGADLGICRERARQLETRALEKLRRAAALDGLGNVA